MVTLHLLPINYPSYGEHCLYVFSGKRIAKVGRTCNLDARRWCYPLRTCLAYITPCESVHRLERELVALFMERFERVITPRLRGRPTEWFYASDIQAYTVFTEYAIQIGCVVSYPPTLPHIQPIPP